jgi:hypothetical protein
MKKITASVMSLVALIAVTLSPSLATAKSDCCNKGGACCKSGACCRTHHVK